MNWTIELVILRSRSILIHRTCKPTNGILQIQGYLNGTNLGFIFKVLMPLPWPFTPKIFSLQLQSYYTCTWKNFDL